MLKDTWKSAEKARTGAGEELVLDTFPDSTGRPTGQGFGAARIGPSVVTMNRGGMAKQKYNTGGAVAKPAWMRNR